MDVVGAQGVAPAVGDDVDVAAGRGHQLGQRFVRGVVHAVGVVDEDQLRGRVLQELGDRPVDVTGCFDQTADLGRLLQR